jgi:hypothetical protein
LRQPLSVFAETLAERAERLRDVLEPPEAFAEPL